MCYSFKRKKRHLITNTFQKILNELGWKPKKIWSDDIVKRCNNSYHSTIKMKPFDVKSSTDIDSSKENNEKYPKFKIGDIFRKSKLKRCLPFLTDLIGKEIFGTFYENELQKKNNNNNNK